MKIWDNNYYWKQLELIVSVHDKFSVTAIVKNIGIFRIIKVVKMQKIKSLVFAFFFI